MEIEEPVVFKALIDRPPREGEIRLMFAERDGTSLAEVARNPPSGSVKCLLWWALKVAGLTMRLNLLAQPVADRHVGRSHPAGRNRGNRGRNAIAASFRRPQLNRLLVTSDDSYPIAFRTDRDARDSLQASRAEIRNLAPSLTSQRNHAKQFGIFRHQKQARGQPRVILNAG